MTSEMFKWAVGFFGVAALLISLALGYVWLYSDSAWKLSERRSALRYFIIGFVILDIMGMAVYFISSWTTG